MRWWSFVQSCGDGDGRDDVASFDGVKFEDAGFIKVDRGDEFIRIDGGDDGEDEEEEGDEERIDEVGDVAPKKNEGDDGDEEGDPE